jgi:hypothetical protein
MLDADDPQNAVFLSDPDSLRRQDAPNNWQGWDSTSAETTFTRYQNLTPGKSYLFAVTGFDEAGDYDPVFRRDKNVLHIRVQLEETGGPDLLVQAPGLFQFSEGGWADDPASAIRCEVAAGRPLRVRLVAQPTGGLDLLGHRWVLDPVDPDDETPRAGPDDFAHWSPWTSEPVIDLGVQGGASFKRSVHRLYFQVRTGHGGCNGFEGDFVSKGLFEYVVVRATMNRELLIVDDTRLQVDRHDPNDGALLPYTGPWPSATELDTFLYARGGVPWHGTFNPPAGVLSSPGLFAGFAFDTLGTRGLRTGFGVTEPINSSRLDGTVPLSVLADYRHVIWLTDPLATVFSSPVDDPLSPMSTLRHMSSARERNVLSTYSDMGGKLWLVGATATAACMPWDRTQNNSPVPRFSASQGELSEGRMPWDAVHLRSEVARASGTTVTRSLGRFSADPGLFGPLPTALDRRNVTFDPLPPTRFSVSQFNVNSFFVETISLPNSIIEDLDPDPEFGLIASTLDSIYSASGNTVPGTLPAMALYHGSDNGQVLWSGFDIWSFKRADCAAIVNWVLQDLWGLTPSPQPNQPTAAPRSGRRTATVVPDRRVTVPAARPVSR